MDRRIDAQDHRISNRLVDSFRKFGRPEELASGQIRLETERRIDSDTEIFWSCRAAGERGAGSNLHVGAGGRWRRSAKVVPGVKVSWREGQADRRPPDRAGSWPERRIH